MIRQALKFLLVIVPACICMMTTNAKAASDCMSLLRNDLAQTIAQASLNDDTIEITSDGLVEFFAKNIDSCRDYLLSKTSDDDIDVSEIDHIVSVHWDYLVEEVAAALTVSAPVRQLFVCENNKGYMGAIDAALWAVTIVASVFSFGSASVAVQGGRAAVVQGAKSLTKIGVQKGMKAAAIDVTAKRLGLDIAGKTAARDAALVAAREAAQSSAQATAKVAAEQAAKSAATAAAKDAAVVAAKNSLHAAGKKRVGDTMLKKELETMLRTATASTTPTKAQVQQGLNLVNDKIAKQQAKRAAAKALNQHIAQTSAASVAAQTALDTELALASNALKSALLKFSISTPIALAGGMASIYSWVADDLNPAVMNCTNTDAGEYCYLSCTKDNLSDTSDDLNTKIFKPMLGKNLCVDEDNNYVLREIPSSGLPMAGDVAIIPESKWTEMREAIKTTVADKGKCDWNEDDIDMYVGVPLYDASTLQPIGSGATGIIVDAIRLDD